jgi:peptidylprolyl isomerase
MQQAQQGDTVNVHYTGTLDDGSVFDSSQGGEPIQFTIGSGEVISGFEEAVLGMSAGQTKRERFPADRAYGDRRDDLVFEVNRSQFPAAAEVQVGDVVRIGFEDGTSAPVQVSDVEGDRITLDANHPLAGQALTFDLTLVSIE